MHRRRRGALAVLLAFLPAAAPPGVRAEGGAGAPPAPPVPPARDDRFFPRDLAERLQALDDAAGDDESRYDALAAIARMRGLDGALEPLRADAYDRVLARALSSRHEAFVATAGEFLAALDRDRLLASMKKSVAGDGGGTATMANLATLAGEAGADDILCGSLVAAPSKEARVRAVEALGLRRVPAAVAPAIALLADRDPEVRCAAALALGRIGDRRAVPALLSGLSTGDGSVPWFCAEALGRIEDPEVFAQVMGRSSGGKDAGPRAKAIEACAREANVPQLLAMLRAATASPSTEVRVAAAVALGRLLPGLPAAPAAANGPANSPTDAKERDRPSLREEGADVLLDTLAGDRDPEVRGQCYLGLRAAAVASTGPQVLRRIGGVQGDDKLLYMVLLLGELRVKESAKVLAANIFSQKRELLRRALALSFWKVADAEAIADFARRLKEADAFETVQRGCIALGSWKSKEGFDLALDLLRRMKAGSREQFQVEMALEKMTGHFFGTSASVWERWWEKNPKFFTAKQQHLERERWREEFDKENRGFRQTKETEAAVQRGLQWLARHQGLDGAWDCVSFKDRCDAKEPCDPKAGARTQIARGGTTGLSCLSFTGAGYAPGAGKYRHAIRRGLDYLVSAVGVGGDFAEADLLFNRAYARPVALQALCEGFAVTGDPAYRRAAERILGRELTLMNDRGGWRYSLTRDTPEVDSSVSAWVLFSLKSADKAGLPVPPIVFEGAYLAFDQLSERVPQNGPREEWIDIDSEYGYEVGKDAKYLFQTGYQDPSGAASRATTPLGLMSRIFLGWRRSHPFCIGSANYIVKNYLPDFDVFGEPGKEDWSRAGRFTPKGQWVMYSYYYCTLALHQMGGRFFRDWNRRIGRILPVFQNRTGCDRGSFDGWNTDRVYGRIYATAMGVLTLETYYRYAPILQD